MNYKHLYILIALTLLTLLTSCNNGGEMAQHKNSLSGIKDIPDSAFEKLSHKKIFFGHQSVGYNIIDGIKDVMNENPQIKLNIVETTDPEKFSAGILAHSRVGKNMDPESKVKDFITFMENGIGNKADMAGLKFCYVDIRGGSNIESIFQGYDKSISQLKSKFPGINVIHFTTPLTRIQTGPKVWIKKLIGRSTTTDDNYKRNEYNKLILSKYNDNGSVFDLATIESTSPDGARCSFIKNGKTYYSMCNEYTDDGGHLNKLGRKIVAEQFLIFIANMSVK
jgi:hypothetical protein